MNRERGRRQASGAGVLLAAALLLLSLALVARPASGAAPNCKVGKADTIEVGIVKAVGCWTQSSNQQGQTVYTGAFDTQDEGIDLNGFRVTAPSGGGALTINTSTREVKAIKDDGTQGFAQLNSRGWPSSGNTALGGPLELYFVAPLKSGLLLEDLRFGGGSQFIRGLAGLSPVGDVETPVMLEEDGTGSMDMTIQLAGGFTLKGHPQSLTIALPTASEKGTKLDGFELSLQEIDAFKVVTINELEAKYSAASKEISGSATATFPWTKPGSKGVGFGIGFALVNGSFTNFHGKAVGLKIPIGAPPGGLVTSIGGSWDRNPDTGAVVISATLGAELGPEIPLPWGNVAPIDIDAALGAGFTKDDVYFIIRGGVQVFRLSVGDVYLAIHSSAGIEFGIGLGVGLPSFKNNPKDPFYIGARVAGWVGKGHFQLEGSGHVALAGANIFDGRILVNDKAAGACWKVLWFPGGAVYKYGTGKVQDFGVSCGLDDYKEKFPQAASASAGHPRQIRLQHGEGVLAVKGDGAAPRFTLRSKDGRVIDVPADRDSLIQRTGVRHAFFVNEATQRTHVIIPDPEGVWTVTPHEGSVAITSLKATGRAPKERVKARVRGTGLHRTLVWSSLNRPHTRLLFTERLRGGQEVPILETGKPAGRKRFRVSAGALYGKRALRVQVLHGFGVRQSKIADRFHVGRPPRLRAPRQVSAWRHNHDVYVKWSGVHGARSYMVQVSMRQSGRVLTNFVRRVGPRHRSIVIKHHPGGGVAVARVYAMNADDKRGHPGKQAFKTNPTARTLGQAVRRDVRSAHFQDGKVRLMMRCPKGGHCRTEVRVLNGKRVIGRAHYQQTPDTFHLLGIKARAGSGGGQLKVVVKVRRGGGHATARGSVSP